MKQQVKRMNDGKYLWQRVAAFILNYKVKYVFKLYTLLMYYKIKLENKQTQLC